MILSAAILAGGRAVRFGGLDKSSLIVGGRTIFDRQVEELSTIANEILWIGSRTPRPGVRSIADREAGHGPLGGVQTALLEAQADVTLVVACDMPYISGPLLAYLAALASSADIVVPKTERGYHPLCAAYTRAVLEPIARHIEAGRLRMTDLLGAVKLRVVAAEEISRFGDRRRLLTNVNTPAEYGELEAFHAHKP